MDDGLSKLDYYVHLQIATNKPTSETSMHF